MVVRYRDIESSESKALGTAKIQLADVIQSANLTFQQQCPVKTMTNEIIIGRLLIRVQLGCRGLHFGADFLEAISLNVIDDCVHSAVSSECYSNCPYSNREYTLNTRLSNDRKCLDSQKISKWHDHKHRINELLYETCVHDNHDDQTENKSDNPSTPLSIESHSNDTQRTNGRNVGNMMDGMSDRDLAHALEKVDETNDDDMGDGLEGLFHIGQINYCSWYQSTLDTFLVCRPFWITDSALVTEKCQNKTNEGNYQLNYLEVRRTFNNLERNIF